MEFPNLYAAYRAVCRKYADRTLFRIQGISFGETWNRVEKRALFLRRQGFAKGDVLAILGASSPEWCMSYMAITAIGAIALPLDTNLSPETYREMLKSAGAKGLFAAAPFRDLFPDLTVFSLAAEPEENAGANSAAETLAEPAIQAGDIASLLFTSGTTGAPKIVSLTHGNILHVAQVCTELEEYTPADVTLAMLPLYHVYAFESTFMAPLLTGSAIVFQNSLKGPDIIRTLGEHPITIFPAAPQMWELFFDALLLKIRTQSRPKYRLFLFFLKAAPVLKALGMGFLPKQVFKPVHDVFGHGMRFFISGGAPLKRSYFEAYRRMGFYIMEGYGLTETTGPIAIPYYRDAVAGAVGPPIAGNEVRIKEVNADGIGEIWLRGKAVMAGYYQNPEANREAFDGEGFFNTRDLGFVDDRGHIHITGRKKNVIVLHSGKNVYPEELELYYRQSPAIAEIAVFGRNDGEGHETVYAVIVPALKGAGSYAAIRGEIARLNRTLPGYKALTRFALSADPLPRNSTRKVLIDEVIRLLEQGVYQTEATGAAIPRNLLSATSLREEEIIACLVRKLRAERLYANETLADHRIDSLGMIELIVFLEAALEIAVETEKVSPFQTLEEFVRILAACPERAGANHLDETILRGTITTGMTTFWNPLSELILGLVRLCSRLFWDFQVLHGERLVPDNAIIVANHQSNLDAPWIISTLPYRLRKRLFVIGKREVAFLGLIFAGEPLLFVDRRGNVVPALKAAADVLRSGGSLLIFPEGTRSADGVLGPLKSGAAYLALHLERPIIPVTITGSRAILPKGKWCPDFFGGAKGRLVVGESLDPRAFASVEALSDRIRGAILSGQVESPAETAPKSD
ncbi:MAG: AMP-binding protein [Deltaproteobacteria bacterium]|nr:AMP-binding protein [Deltaproteobacteria bacterium]